MGGHPVRYSLLIGSLLFAVSCEGGNMSKDSGLAGAAAAVSEQELQKVARKKIFFGHQSVGYNLLDGVRDILREKPGAAISIVDTTDPAMFYKPLFAHSAVGMNTDPGSKLSDFTKILDSGIGGKAAVAFVKFCYVDVTAESDAEKLFRTYQDSMALLKKKYPRATFVHLTVPLTSDRTDLTTLLKNTVKKVIGRPVRSYRDNITRDRYNSLLRRAYAGKEPLFDLAAIESTFPNGERVVDQRNGTTVYSLAPVYTDDGGHLNRQGRRIAAAQLLRFLAELPDGN